MEKKKAKDIKPGDVVIVRHPVETPGDVQYSRFTVEAAGEVGPQIHILYHDGRHKHYMPDAELEIEGDSE